MGEGVDGRVGCESRSIEARQKIWLGHLWRKGSIRRSLLLFLNSYSSQKRILYLGAGKLDILDAHINLRRVIPLEARSVKADGDLGFDVSSPWSVYSFECANAKERDSWVRKISLQIMRANTRFDDNSWERKGYLAMNKRKSCFFGLKGGKLYYFRSAQQGTGKRFVLADCKIRMVDTREDTFIEITFKVRD